MAVEFQSGSRKKSGSRKVNYQINLALKFKHYFSLKSGWTDPRANVLGILVFSIAFALAITRVENDVQRKSLQNFFSGVNEAIMKLIYILIW